MNESNSDPKKEKLDKILKLDTGSLCAIDLPTFGKIYVTPYINVGTIMEVEKNFSSREPTATELVDIVFAGRAEVENSNGEFRAVTSEEVAKLTDEDRFTFARKFLELVRDDEISNVEGAESPVEALAAYIVAEWRALQESTKELAGMIKAGFSVKTINLFKESQSLAERVMAASKLPHFSALAKFQSSFGDFGSAAGAAFKGHDSPAIKAALRMTDSPTWKSIVEHTESPVAKTLRQLEHTQLAAARRTLDYSRQTTTKKAFEYPGLTNDRKRLLIDTLPRFKTTEEVMAEQLGMLKKDLGERMDRVGNAAVDIALQQDKTNSTIMSALVDIRIKWKEDEKSSRIAFLFAAFSLVISALLTAMSVYQDYRNNKESDKYQEQVTQLMTQQTQAMEQQRQLLEQLAKTNKALASQLKENAKNSALMQTTSK